MYMCNLWLQHLWDGEHTMHEVLQCPICLPGDDAFSPRVLCALRVACTIQDRHLHICTAVACMIKEAVHAG